MGEFWAKVWYYLSFQWLKNMVNGYKALVIGNTIFVGTALVVVSIVAAFAVYKAYDKKNYEYKDPEPDPEEGRNVRYSEDHF